MRMVLALAVLSIVVCSCGERGAPSAQDLRDAPESIVIGNAVLRLKAFPWEDHMPVAALRDPTAGLTLPDPRKMKISFRLISEHGTPLSSMIRAQVECLPVCCHSR
jgi:hypothetical protein